MVCYKQVLAYLGYRGNNGDAQTREAIAKAEAELNEVCGAIKTAAGIWECRIAGDTVTLNSKTIKSESLAAHLEGAKYIGLLAVTMGVQADRLISRYAVTDMRMSVITGAVASAMVNTHCEKVCAELAAHPDVAVLRMTKRFSPGYGDFSLAYQHDVLTLLNAHKRIGLTLTQANMLVPEKSVTAVVGFI